MSEFAKWDTFYVIVGSAAGALIGLQFVVMILIAERPPLRAAEAGAAFGTPTIVPAGEPIRNKVTGAESRAPIALPNCFEQTKAEFHSARPCVLLWTSSPVPRWRVRRQFIGLSHHVGLIAG